MAEEKKSLDELLKKKANKENISVDENDELTKDAMRARMNRTVNANKIFEEPSKDKQEKKDEGLLKTRLDKLLALKYGNYNVINENDDSFNADLINDIEKDKDALKKLKDEIKALKKEKKDNDTLIKDLKQDLKDKKDEIDVLSKELKESKANAKPSSKANSKPNPSTTKADKQIEKLNQDKASLKQELSALKKEVSTKDTKIEKLNENLSKQALDVSSKNQELKKLNNLNNKLNEKISKLEDEKKKLDASYKKKLKTLEQENLKQIEKFNALYDEYQAIKNNESEDTSNTQIEELLKALEEKENENLKLKDVISKLEESKSEDDVTEYQEMKLALEKYIENKRSLDAEIRECLAALSEQDDIIEAQNKLLERQENVLNLKSLELVKMKDAYEEEIASLNKELSLKEEKASLEQVALGSVNDIERKEVLALEKEIEVLHKEIEEYENLLSSNKETIELRDKIDELVSELEEEKKKNKEVSKVDLDALFDSSNKYREILENERRAHILSEEMLQNEISELNYKLKEQLEKANTYSINYLFNALYSQVSTINEIIESYKNGDILVNRDLYSNEYINASVLFNNQKEKFKKEILKRNSFLADVKKVLREELGLLKEKKDKDAKDRCIKLEKLITEIEVVLSNEYKLDAMKSPEALEEAVIVKTKQSIIEMHKDLENNFKELERSINTKYEGAKSLDELVEIYDLDCEEMARKYASDIEKLYILNSLDNNEYSKLLREEKILIMANNFQKLIRIRDSKYASLEDKYQLEINANSVKDFNDSLDALANIKKDIIASLDNLQIEKEKEINGVKDEIISIEEEIKDLNKQIDIIESAEDKKKLANLIRAKQDKIEYLNSIRILEIERSYNEEASKIKGEYAKVSEDERKTKEAFDKRIDALNATRRLKAYNDKQSLKEKGFEDINSYLLSLNNIDKILNEVKKERVNLLANLKDSNEVSNKVESKNDIYKAKENKDKLWMMYDKYVMLSKKMEEESADVRKYLSAKAESDGAYNQYLDSAKIQSELENDKKSGKKVDPKELKNATVKMAGFRGRYEFLSKQASSYKNIKQVKEYIEVCAKIKEVLEMLRK